MADNEYFKAKFESERFARISDFDSPAGRAAVAAFTKMTTSTVINDVYEAADSLQRHLASIDTPEARRDRLAALADRAGDNKSRSRAILSAIVDIPVEKLEEYFARPSWANRTTPPWLLLLWAKRSLLQSTPPTLHSMADAPDKARLTDVVHDQQLDRMAADAVSVYTMQLPPNAPFRSQTAQQAIKHFLTVQSAHAAAAHIPVDNKKAVDKLITKTIDATPAMPVTLSKLCDTESDLVDAKTISRSRSRNVKTKTHGDGNNNGNNDKERKKGNKTKNNGGKTNTDVRQ